MARRRKNEAVEGSGAATATSTSSEVAAADTVGKRGELCIVNESAGEVWLGLGTAAIAHQGPYLRPYGGAWWTPANDTVFMGAVNCIQEGDGDLILSYYEY